MHESLNGMHDDYKHVKAQLIVNEGSIPHLSTTPFIMQKGQRLTKASRLVAEHVIFGTRCTFSKKSALSCIFMLYWESGLKTYF